MSLVICDKKDTCREATQCGGAQPHQLQPGDECNDGECNNCPFDKDAKCIPVEDSNDKV